VGLYTDVWLLGLRCECVYAEYFKGECFEREVGIVGDEKRERGVFLYRSVASWVYV